MPKEIFCKICGAVLKQNELKAHLKEHSSLDPDPMPQPKSIFGVR